jgi:hypothetical protein
MATNDGSGASFFARYIDTPKERTVEPEIPRGPLLRPIVPPSDHRSPPIEKCLDWLVNRWPKPTVRVRDILQFGPNPIRNRTSAIATAEILAQRGWLSPLPTRQHNEKMWAIVREGVADVASKTPYFMRVSEKPVIT